MLYVCIHRYILFYLFQEKETLKTTLVPVEQFRRVLNSNKVTEGFSLRSLDFFTISMFSSNTYYCYYVFSSNCICMSLYPMSLLRCGVIFKRNDDYCAGRWRRVKNGFIYLCTQSSGNGHL